MPRPPNIIRPSRLEIALPEDQKAWLDLHLWSDSEARVPHGAYSRFFQKLLRHYRDHHEFQHLPMNVEAKLPEALYEVVEDATIP